MKTARSINARQAGQRLDIYCTTLAPDYSRSQLQQAIKAGHITVNSRIVKPNYLLHEADTISINLQTSATTEPAPIADNIRIIFEDKDIAVINKPSGVLTHPASHSSYPAVSTWFADRYPQAANVGEDITRPGIVHRLDRDTTGVLALAKTPEAFTHLKAQFKKHRAKKEYLALVHGVPGATDGRINQPIARSPRNPNRRTIQEGGKLAITEWQVEQIFTRYTLVRLLPLTGRTHQLRVHMHFISHPIVGDPIYTFKRQKTPPGVIHQLLHAAKLTISLPTGKKKSFTADLPPDIQSILDNLT